MIKVGKDRYIFSDGEKIIGGCQRMRLQEFKPFRIGMNLAEEQTVEM